MLPGTLLIKIAGVRPSFHGWLLRALQAIGRAQPLLITHRLDTCTEGVLIMGKTKEFVQRFNASLLVPGALQKTYRAVTKVPVSPGAPQMLLPSCSVCIDGRGS